MKIVYTKAERMIKNSILIFLPQEEFNEEEYLITKKILEKSGFRIFIASDANTVCRGSKGMRVKNDVSFFNMNEANFSAFVLIGGSGARTYWGDGFLHTASRKFKNAKKVLAAICSAPIIFAKAGILNGERATCYPGDRKELEKSGVKYDENEICISGNIITAQKPSSAGDFANAIVNKLLK